MSQLVQVGTDLEGMSGFARMLQVSVASVGHWRMGNRHPMLPAYLRLARVLDVTLVSLLTGRVSPDEIDSLNLAGVPHWRNLWARQRSGFDRLKTAQQMDLALKEFPPCSPEAFQNRNGYHMRPCTNAFRTDAERSRSGFKNIMQPSSENDTPTRLRSSARSRTSCARGRAACEPRAHADVRAEESRPPHRTRTPGRD